MWKKTRDFIVNILFPCFCLNCGKEGDYLCQDCKSILEISEFHQKLQEKNLDDLYWALNYQRPLNKNLIQKFKYKPFIKELAKPLSCLIIDHFQLLATPPKFFEKKLRRVNSAKFLDYILIPIPLYGRRLKWRGFNQAEEIAKELSYSLKIPLINNVLVKIKKTLPQVELSEKQRKENIKGVFVCKNAELIREKKILLIDDIYTTGSTMEECARVLKNAGSQEVIGIVLARG